MHATLKNYILIILIFLLSYHLGFSTPSKNLWDTIGSETGMTGNEDPQAYEQKLCSLDSIDCYRTIPCANFTENEEECNKFANCTFSCGICQENDNLTICLPCENFNYDTGACRQQGHCWYSCKQKLCLHKDEFDESEKCSQFCNFKCKCWEQDECHYHWVHTKKYLQESGYSKFITEGCYRNSDTITCDELMAQHFGTNDCIRGSANNTFYFLNGVLCSSKSEEDSGNCEVEEVLDGGTANSVTRNVNEESRLEFKMTVKNISWDTGDTQLYEGFLSDATLTFRLTKEQLQDKANETITVVFNFYVTRFPNLPGFPNELGLLDIAGVGKSLTGDGHYRNNYALFIWSNKPGCPTVGNSDNKVYRKVVKFKN